MIPFNEAFQMLQDAYFSGSQTSAFEKLSLYIKEDDVINGLKESKCPYSKQPFTWKYSCYLFYLLDDVAKNPEFKPNDFNHNSLFTEVLIKCAQNALEICVKKHRDHTLYATTDLTDDEYLKLIGCLRMFHKYFSLPFLPENTSLDDARIDYIVGLFGVLARTKNRDEIIEFNQMLDKIHLMIGTELFFRYVMMARGFQGLNSEYYSKAITRIKQLICDDDGYYTLCKVLLIKKLDDTQICRKYTLVTNILMTSMKGKNNHEKMVGEVFKALKKSINTNQNEIMIACIHSLKELGDKKEEIFDVELNKWILGSLDKLIKPDILLCGSILLEYNDIKDYTAMLNVLFSPASILSLPTKFLHRHIVALFNLYAILPDIPEKNKLSFVILYVINNYDRKELHQAIKHLRYKDDSNILKIHPRVVYKNDSIQIGEETTILFDDTSAFIQLVKNSNNNVLIYEIFISLIKLLSDFLLAGDKIITGCASDVDELADMLNIKFSKQLAIIEPLMDMIQWKSLQSQLNEKPKEILEVIRDVLESAKNQDEHIVTIFFSIYKELLYKIRDVGEQNKMLNEILKIKEKFKDEKLKEQIDIILSRDEEVPAIDPLEFTFNDAMKLFKSKEAYCKVYGCDNFIKMIKNREKHAVANRHTILAVALQNIKDAESYVYLNVIKLLVALSYVMDTEVVEALIAEYKNKELQIDERLKFGEVAVKVTENLGELAVKFKEQLINCFLNGSRDTNDEFRTSSLSNLGTICKILSYQVHNFFHEMYQQLEVIIKSDKYLPSKRAATMVLSQILAGMSNLMDFQDFLLPIYHLLKDVLANDEDEQTKLHAQIGFEHLNEKTKEFLNPKLDLEKEIKIRVGDNHPNKLDDIKYK